MLFMLLIKASRNSEGANLPNRELMNKMDRFNDQLDQAGIKRMAKGLYPTSQAVRFSYRETDQPAIVTKGPFPYHQDLIAGFFIIEVDSFEEAFAWASKVPDPQGFGEGEVELRQII